MRVRKGLYTYYVTRMLRPVGGYTPGQYSPRIVCLVGFNRFVRVSRQSFPGPVGMCASPTLKVDAHFRSEWSASNRRMPCLIRWLCICTGSSRFVRLMCASVADCSTYECVSTIRECAFTRFGFVFIVPTEVLTLAE